MRARVTQPCTLGALGRRWPGEIVHLTYPEWLGFRTAGLVEAVDAPGDALLRACKDLAEEDVIAHRGVPR